MQIKYSKEGIAFWHAVGGKEAMIDLKVKSFLSGKSILPRNRDANKHSPSLLLSYFVAACLPSGCTLVEIPMPQFRVWNCTGEDSENAFPLSG